jgi:membrane fusion protein (multidrug efflux system)
MYYPSHKPLKARLVLLLGLFSWPYLGMTQDEVYVAPVSYTEARQHTMRPSLKLPGTIQSRHRSIIGSETEGIVVAMYVREGESVSQGAPIAQLRTDSLQQLLKAAGSALDATRAARELAKRSLDRARPLFDKESMSEQQVDELESELLRWQADEQRLKAEIARIELTIEHSHIRAPFDGVIVARLTDIGEWRDAGDPVVELISINDLEIDVAVPVVYFDDLNADEPAAVSFPSISEERFEMDVTAVVPVANSNARTFIVKLRLANDPEQPRVAVGMLANVWLSIGQSRSAIIVPKDAIVRRQQERLLVLISEGNLARFLTVQTGNSIGDWIEVHNGVSAGDRVVVRGNERLEPDTLVDPKVLDYPLP